LITKFYGYFARILVLLFVFVAILVVFSETNWVFDTKYCSQHESDTFIFVNVIFCGDLDYKRTAETHSNASCRCILWDN